MELKENIYKHFHIKFKNFKKMFLYNLKNAFRRDQFVKKSLNYIEKK